jgi:hypothetical protein
MDDDGLMKVGFGYTRNSAREDMKDDLLPIAGNDGVLEYEQRWNRLKAFGITMFISSIVFSVLALTYAIHKHQTPDVHSCYPAAVSLLVAARHWIACAYLYPNP